MPYKERETVKMFYTIGEVSTLLNVNQSLLRFWEKEFDIIKPKKNKKGNRLFSPQDIENLKMIHHLVKDKGFTLAGARTKLKEGSNGVSKQVELKESLMQIRGFLVELKESL